MTGPLQRDQGSNSQRKATDARDGAGQLASAAGLAAARRGGRGGGSRAGAGARCRTSRRFGGRAAGGGTARRRGRAATGGRAVGAAVGVGRGAAAVGVGGGGLVGRKLVAALVDDANHAALAVAVDCAVEEDGVRVVDGDAEDSLRETNGVSISHRDIPC